MVTPAVHLKDIAQAAGVSVVAVSSALNGKGRISQDLAKRIQQIAQNMGYVRNSLASAMATGRSNTLAFVINHEDVSAGHISLILGGILNVLEQHGFSLKIYDAESLSRDLIIRRLQEQQINGVLLHHYSLDILRPWLEDLNRIGLPACIINMNNTTGYGTGVIADEAKATEQAVDYLASLGHVRIAHVTVDHDYDYVLERRKGYLAGMSKLANATAELVEVNLTDFTHNQEVLRDVLKRPPTLRPTAFVCASDHHAMELFRATYALGLNVPNDVSIIGFGNLDLALYAPVPLTTIAQPFKDIGEAATQLLLHDIMHPRSPEPHTISLPTQLIFRESVTKPKPRCN